MRSSTYQPFWINISSEMIPKTFIPTEEYTIVRYKFETPRIKYPAKVVVNVVQDLTELEKVQITTADFWMRVHTKQLTL